MSRKFFTLLPVMCMLCTTMLSAQQYDAFVERFREYQRVHAEPTTGTLTYDQIKGNPYYFEDFKPARVVMNNGETYLAKLRFDLYAGEMEYESNGKSYWVGDQEEIRYIVIGEDTFVFTGGDGRKKSSWYQLLADGRYRLLARHSVLFNEAQPAKPYQDPVPAQFKRRPVIYFFQAGARTPVEVRNKKSVESFFGDQGAAALQYLRKNKLGLRKPEELAKLVRYMNSR